MHQLALDVPWTKQSTALALGIIYVCKYLELREGCTTPHVTGKRLIGNIIQKVWERIVGDTVKPELGLALCSCLILQYRHSLPW